MAGNPPANGGDDHCFAPPLIVLDRRSTRKQRESNAASAPDRRTMQAPPRRGDVDVNTVEAVARSDPPYSTSPSVTNLLSGGSTRSVDELPEAGVCSLSL